MYVCCVKNVIIIIATQLQTTCVATTLTPQIKVKSGAMFPFAPGQHHDVAQEGGSYTYLF